MNPPKVTEEDYINFIIATPRQVTATEAERVQPASKDAAAHDAFTRLLSRLEPDAERLWEEAMTQIDLNTGIRVSRKRPCLICGKPDWCSRAADDSISFCARVTAGADRLIRKERWGVFYHDRTLLDNTFWQNSEPRQFPKKQPKEIAPAPLEIRDFIYASLVRLSPTSSYECLTTGKKGLGERGLDNYFDYGALPCFASNRKDLATQMRLLLNQNFPSFVRENPHGLADIPGFWVNDSGQFCLWFEKDYSRPMLLIPYRNPWGKIQSCQIRFYGSVNSVQKRFLWLSLLRPRLDRSNNPRQKSMFCFR